MFKIEINSAPKRIGVSIGILIIIIIFLSLAIFKSANCLADKLAERDSLKEDISLLEAYEKNDVEKAKQYFENWNKESKELTKTKFSDSLEESLYGIYKEFFRPYELDPLLDYRMMDFYEYDLIEVINKTPYVVTQYNISYIIHDFKKIKDLDILNYFNELRIDRNEIKTLEDFYPKTDLDEEKVLHLTKKYESELNLFLGTREHPLGENNIMSPASPKEETLKRYQFIRNYIPILYGHWGGYWHLSTHPEIGIVFINPELDHAVLDYRIGYTFGWAELKKETLEWKMVRAIMNGME